MNEQANPIFSVLNSPKLNPLSILNKIIFKIFSPALKFLDLKTRYLEKSITSGWFLIVKKK